MRDATLPTLSLDEVALLGAKIADLRGQEVEYQRLGSPRNAKRCREEIAALTQLLLIDSVQEKKKLATVRRRINRAGDALISIVRAGQIKDKLALIQQAIRSGLP